MSASRYDVATAILDLVGPPGWRDMQITGLRLEIASPRSTPQLTLEIRPHVQEGARARTIRRHFRFEPTGDTSAETPPLDLDAMEHNAQQRVRRCINKAAEFASRGVQQQFERARVLAELRHMVAVQDHRRGIVHHVCFGPAGRYADGGRLQGGWRLVGETPPELNSPVGKTHEPRIAARVTAAAGATVLAIALGWFGPALDAQPDRRAEWLQAEQELQAAGALAAWEAEARARCAARTGENGTYIQVEGGGIVCTDKRGRRAGRPL